jgi:hypothetical protein
MTFDTLKLARKLHDAGFSTEQAESLVEALADSRDETATKHDIDLVRRDLEGVRQELKADVRPSLWMLGVLVAANVALLIRVYA